MSREYLARPVTLATPSRRPVSPLIASPSLMGRLAVAVVVGSKAGISVHLSGREGLGVGDHGLARGFQNCVEDVGVGAAPADVAGEPVLDLVERGFGDVIEERAGGHDEAG